MADKVCCPGPICGSNNNNAAAGGFREAVQSVAYLADVSTPVLLPAHYERFEHFNRVKFVPSDFIEEVDFTAFILERVKEDKPERHIVGKPKLFPTRSH